MDTAKGTRSGAVPADQPATAAAVPDVEPVVTSWAARPDRVVIFDFNGTLSDDEPLLLRLYTEMFLERLQWKLTPQHYYQRFAGRSDREIIDIVVEEVAGHDEVLVADLLAERRTRYCAMVEKQSPIQRPTVATVQRLSASGVPLGIVTGAQRIDVEFVLAHSPIGDQFPVIVTEEDVQRGKPDPQGFHIAADALSVDPAAALVFEDSIFGIRGAKAAGMGCIAVEGTRSRDDLAEEADAVVSRISPELFAILSAGGSP